MSELLNERKLAQPSPRKTISLSFAADFVLLLMLAGESMKKAWRMSFRCGNRGPKMWPDCLRFGVAALTYSPIHKTDLTRHLQEEPRQLWARLAPAQKASLKRVAYEMEKGDTIYVKEGRHIIGRGTVLGPYRYDRGNRIRDPNGFYWNHQVPVRWQTDFPPIPILLGAEQFTVRPLSAEDVKKLDVRISSARTEAERGEVIEGQRVRAEASFRKRNRTVIAAKKAVSDGHCEACHMRFDTTYGIRRDCLVAHHKKPIGKRRRPSKTSVDDIALLCPNCHAVTHTNEPPLSVSSIGEMLQENGHPIGAANAASPRR
jgi:hypothetical protein